VASLAVLFALLSATSAAASTSLQHRASQGALPGVRGVWALFGPLVRQPLWVVGQILGITTVSFHALALLHGPITLVQPLVVSGIVLAVPLRAAMEHRLPGRTEMIALVTAAAGLALFLVVSAPSSGSPARPGLGSALVVLACLGLATAALIRSPSLSDPTRRSFLLGGASGIFFGLVAVLLKMTVNELARTGAEGTVTAWPLYVLILAGAGGIVGNQLAYRAGRLSSSMPVLNIVDVLLAITLGYVLFHEVARHTVGALMLEGVGLLAMLTGLWFLALDAATVAKGSQ
jgi:hypothetical protein